MKALTIQCMLEWTDVSQFKLRNGHEQSHKMRLSEFRKNPDKQTVI